MKSFLLKALVLLAMLSPMVDVQAQEDFEEYPEYYLDDDKYNEELVESVHDDEFEQPGELVVPEEPADPYAEEEEFERLQGYSSDELRDEPGVSDEMWERHRDDALTM